MTARYLQILADAEASILGTPEPYRDQVIDRMWERVMGAWDMAREFAEVEMPGVWLRRVEAKIGKCAA